MNRPQTLKLLRGYLPSRLEEKEYQQKMIEFVEAHENFFSRSNLKGHLTASAWICRPDFQSVLLIHHPTFNLWIQPGGHIEESDLSLADAARREAFEETGLGSLKLSSPTIFDLDIHPIPATAQAPAHFHYDVRFLFTADSQETLSKEAQALHPIQWLGLEQLNSSELDPSIGRMAHKMEAICVEKR